MNQIVVEVASVMKLKIRPRSRATLCEITKLTGFVLWKMLQQILNVWGLGLPKQGTG